MRALICLVLLFSLLAAGCATTQVSTSNDKPAVLKLRFDGAENDAANDALVWPAEPEMPRYRYVGQLLGEQNFPIQKTSFLRRAFAWVVGLGSNKAQAVVLQRPQSGFVDDEGRVYVTDVSRAAVYVFDAKQTAPLVWEMAGQNMRFVTPVGITAGKNGEILVADAELGEVIRLNREGEPAGSIAVEGLQRPTGLARDAQQGVIYVADTQRHQVFMLNDDGSVIKVLGEHGELQGQFNRPTHLTFAGGLLYVSDALNSRIQVFDRAGNWLRSVGKRGLFVGDLPRPKGVGVDSRGNVYVVESYYDYLLVFNDKGEFLLPIGGTGRAIGQFYLPAGVWLDKNDRIYVADTFNGRIVIFQYLGET